MKEDIIKLARAADEYADKNAPAFTTELDEWQEIRDKHFAALVRADEREACAKVCEEVESRAEDLWDKFAYPEDQGMSNGARQCADAIRARGDK